MSENIPSGSHGKPGNLKEEGEFNALLAQALKDSGGGRRTSLLELNVVRADDIEHIFGDEAAEALRAMLMDHLVSLVGDLVPLTHAGHCDMVVLLEDVACGDAAELAHALRDRIESTMFTWHEHPFRLGSHVAILELGPAPASASAWRDLAREVSACAREMGGAGVQVLAYGEQAHARMSGERSWHDHISEIVG